MASCDTCLFYDKEYDDLRRSGNDTLVVGESNDEKHYCRLYPDGIPSQIWKKMQECGAVKQ